MRVLLEAMIPPRLRPTARRAYQRSRDLARLPVTVAQRVVQTPLLLAARRSRTQRKLEIGPGPQRIEGFESLNIVGGRNVDYVWNASKRLPFKDGTFQTIYASHVLEHIPWYQTERVLAEWVRVLAPQGQLEIWVPDGLKICKAFVDAEHSASTDFHNDGWYRFNDEKDPCQWASGRVFSYGDGLGTVGHPNWHLAVFSFRYLAQALKKAGCRDVRSLSQSEVRGHDHGWINLGIAGLK